MPKRDRLRIKKTQQRTTFPLPVRVSKDVIATLRQSAPAGKMSQHVADLIMEFDGTYGKDKLAYRLRDKARRAALKKLFADTEKQYSGHDAELVRTLQNDVEDLLLRQQVVEEQDAVAAEAAEATLLGFRIAKTLELAIRTGGGAGEIARYRVLLEEVRTVLAAAQDSYHKALEYATDASDADWERGEAGIKQRLRGRFDE
jgi:hypothetical protein